jgi:hypothetical protein
MCVGKRRKVAPMQVRPFLPHPINVSHCMVGRHHRSLKTTVKVEPPSPANSTMKKCKVYSTIDGQLISHMDSVNDELDLNPANGKCHRPSSFQRRESARGSPTWATRMSTQSTSKASTKKDVRQVVQRLAQSLCEVVQTLKKMVDLDFN